jgi:hypothetical protein
LEQLADFSVSSLAAAAEKKRLDDEWAAQAKAEAEAAGEKARKESEALAAARAAEHAARERLHQAAAQLVNALEDVKADGGFPMLSMDTQEKVDAAIAAAG